jgi:hypothetical protein
MKPFFEKVDSCWKTNGFVSWMLVSAGVVLAVWQVVDHTHPGISIGLLAAVAGIMTVRPLDKFRAEKFIWVFLLVAFTVLEILAIGKSDAENIEKNREILAGMTGGDSYLNIQPQALPDSERTDSFPLMAFTVGSHTVWDARIEMSEGRTTAENAFDFSKRKTIQPRAYSSTWSGALDDGVIHPDRGKDNIYTIKVWPRNLTTTEELHMRFNTDKNGWETSCQIWRTLPSPRIGSESISNVDWHPVPKVTVFAF